MVTMRAWAIGVGVIVAALLVHAAVPRYHVQAFSVGTDPAVPYVVRLDRWSGRVEIVPAYRFDAAMRQWVGPGDRRGWLDVEPVSRR